MYKKMIRFKGEVYLFIGDNLEDGGAIATEEQFKKFATSYAHLFEDGKVKRFGDIIGTIDDIELLDQEINVDNVDAFFDYLFFPSW